MCVFFFWVAMHFEEKTQQERCCFFLPSLFLTSSVATDRTFNVTKEGHLDEEYLMDWTRRRREALACIGGIF